MYLLRDSEWFIHAIFWSFNLYLFEIHFLAHFFNHSHYVLQNGFHGLAEKKNHCDL